MKHEAHLANLGEYCEIIHDYVALIAIIEIKIFKTALIIPHAIPVVYIASEK
jgi:hypothetical protein